MAKTKVRKLEANSPRITALNLARRPAPEAQAPKVEAAPADQPLPAQEERKNLVLKLIDFLEAF